MPEAESGAALNRIINETVNVVTKPSTLGTTNGSVRQLALQLAIGLRLVTHMGIHNSHMRNVQELEKVTRNGVNPCYGLSLLCIS